MWDLGHTVATFHVDNSNGLGGNGRIEYDYMKGYIDYFRKLGYFEV